MSRYLTFGQVLSLLESLLCVVVAVLSLGAVVLLWYSHSWLSALSNVLQTNGQVWLPYILCISPVNSPRSSRWDPACHDITNTGPEQPQYFSHTVDTATKGGWSTSHITTRNGTGIQRITTQLGTSPNHKMDSYNSPNWKYREYKEATFD